LCEYELRRRNLRLYNTPAREQDAPRWMRVGFELYRRLWGLDFRFFSAGQPSAPRTMLEVHPHACFGALLGRRPFLKQTLEGRLQRQLALYDCKVDVPDAMRVFEEITRHRLLKGVLPLEPLYSAGELDALVAAYTSWLAALHPEQVTLLGDPQEGQVVLPGVELKLRY
jgi:predicted RNase H-like nuclease